MRGFGLCLYMYLLFLRGVHPRSREGLVLSLLCNTPLHHTNCIGLCPLSHTHTAKHFSGGDHWIICWPPCGVLLWLFQTSHWQTGHCSLWPSGPGQRAPPHPHQEGVLQCLPEVHTIQSAMNNRHSWDIIQMWPFCWRVCFVHKLFIWDLDPWPFIIAWPFFSG